MKVITMQGNLGGGMLIGKTPEGTCPECATTHKPEMPHNQQSLAYQYKFREKHGRFPTWADAMAHCTEEVRALWTKGLQELGQEVGIVGPDLTKALSLRQPWAWLMIRPDIVGEEERAAARDRGHIKDIENRKWRTHYRGRVLVHASKAKDQNDYDSAAGLAAKIGIQLPPWGDLQRGGIVGEFAITNCVSEHGSPWFFGPFGFTVADAKPLPFRPCKGMLGFFTPSA